MTKLVEEWLAEFTVVLVPQMYDLPRLLGSPLVCDDEWMFEDEVCADELGACAIHMEWQEPFSIVYQRIA